MKVLDAIVQRRSVRSYLDIPVPKHIISDIFLAAQMAPSSGNVQNCRYVLVDDEGIKDAIADACFSQTWMKPAPVFIVIMSEVSQLKSMYNTRGKNNYLYQNSAAAMQNMLLTATSHGIDSCWVSAFREDSILAILDYPDNYVPTGVLVLGYGSEKVPVPARHEIYALVDFNEYDSKLSPKNFTLKNYADEVKGSIKKSADSAKKTGGFVGKKALDSVKTWIDKKKRSNKKNS